MDKSIIVVLRRSGDSLQTCKSAVERAVGSYRIGVAGMLATALLSVPGCNSQDSNPIPDAPQLSAEAVAECEKFLAANARNGLIRGRPSAAQIEVDERIWNELPIKTKRIVLSAVSCAAFRRARPPGDAYVYATGWRDGERKLMLTRVGAI